MVWPGHRYLPDWIKSIEDNPAALSAAIDGHIREVGYAAKGLVRDWDVLNEVFDTRELTTALGDEAMIGWFKTARMIDPSAKRYYNDYAGLVRGGFPTGHKDHFQETVQYLVDNGAPIDGIGIQGHFGSLLTPPHRLVAELDRWGAFDLDILITEFDVGVPDQQLKADFTRDFLTVCFSHPRVDGILTWGFWSQSHWRPESALFAKDWSQTLMGKQWIELTESWTTDETLVTDQNGEVFLRAFLGDYSITTGESIETLKHENAETEMTVTLK